MTTSPDLPIHQIKDNLRSMWMAGDFSKIAHTISGAAGSFVERLPIAPGARVLDVACGTGNSAIPLARRGAIVTGVDIAPNLLAHARTWASQESLFIDFHEGDVEQLPYPDASFDAVVTMFGAMFAPRPELVASELARVLRPGGLLAMANWNPGSFAADMFKVTARHVPPLPGLPAPVLWGDDAVVRTRLAPWFDELQTTIVPVDFDLPADPSGVVAFFRQNFGPTQFAFQKLDPTGQAALAADLEALWSHANVSPDPARTLVHNQFLQVIATRAA